MEIQEFIELWAGLWFAQRTSYQLNEQTIDNSKAELTVVSLEIEHPEVVKLCQQYQVEPSLSQGGIKVSWDNKIDWGKSQQVGSNSLVFLKTGEFLHPSFRGNYSLGSDEALTLSVVSQDFSSNERIYFASDNLKLRTVLTEYPDGRNETAFYTEIRKLTTS